MTTREEERQRKAAYRARKREEAAMEVPQSPNAPVGGSVAEVVRRELCPLVPPVEFAIALKMAEILDNPSWTSQHGAAARILRDIAAKASKDRVGSKLAQLREARRVDNPVVPIRRGNL